MKTKFLIGIAAFILCFANLSIGQSNTFSFILSTHLTVTYNKTTNLIFPFSVQSIDRGSKDIIVQQPKGTKNIVQVKAGQPNFTQTNLTVITTDGKLYSFTVDYAAQPNQLNILLGNNDSTSDTANNPIALSAGYNEGLVKLVSKKIFDTQTRHGKTNIVYGIELQLNGVYINHDVLYFRLLLQNHSNVSYDVGNVGFTIKDKQKSRRTSTQDLSIKPVYVYRPFVSVQADSSANCVIALSKFTLPDSKYLSIQILEKNGARNLSVRVRNKQIMKAIVIR